MADMPSDFWSGWIVVLTIAGTIGLGWLIVGVYFSGDDHGDEATPVWDETLTEGSNPAPMWWFWMIFVSLIFSVVYLMLYPGLGSYQGTLQWSQGGEYEEKADRFEAAFADERARLSAMSLQDLQQHPKAMASARRIFDQHCSACHGPDAAGQASMFPDLTDDVWQWGGDSVQIERSIRQGRQAVMVGWASILGDPGVEQMADYVRLLQSDSVSGHPSHSSFTQYCAACHGANGAGMAVLGGPNLTDSVWLYGDDDQALLQTIAEGRSGTMPAFQERLDDTQVLLLVAWITR